MTEKRYSTIANNYPSFQDIGTVTLDGYKWLKSRQKDDNAEGLWRIHDKLYDLTNLIDIHPGGSDWIRFTKGTDITEAFEVHHIYMDRVEPMLAKFFVRNATERRNFKLTFEPNGFYRTLRKRMADHLLVANRKPELHTKILIDGLLATTFLAAILAVQLNSYVLVTLATLTLTWTVISAHNFFHRRDNFRMRYFNLAFFSYREWRITHSMSHHLYPNSMHDLEVTMFEPFLCWITDARCKGLVQRYGSWLYGPLIYAVLYVEQFAKRAALSVVGGRNQFHWDDAVPFMLPTVMFLCGGENADAMVVLRMWLCMVFAGSFYFGLVGLNAGHHNHHVVHDGDTLRENLDWGLYTLDTIIDNSDLRKSHFLALTNFGHHALHHLLPTIDHGMLPQLYPILYRTMHEFDTDLQEFPWFFHLYGQLKQLARVQPTDYPTRLKMRLDFLTKYIGR